MQSFLLPHHFPQNSAADMGPFPYTTLDRLYLPKDQPLKYPTINKNYVLTPHKGPTDKAMAGSVVCAGNVTP